MGIRERIAHLRHPRTHSSEAYISWLRSQGIRVGEGSVFYDPASLQIDTQRPHMLHIGSRVVLTSGCIVLAHDYSRSTVFKATGEHVADGGLTWIGDNTFVGMRSIILMGAHVGDNCIVGAGSVVSGRFGDGLVIAGNPARVVGTVEESLGRRRARERDAALECARRWHERHGSWPTPEDMTNAFAWLYLPHTQRSIEEHPTLFALNAVDLDAFKARFLETEPVWPTFEAFLAECADPKATVGGADDPHPARE